MIKETVQNKTYEEINISKKWHKRYKTKITNGILWLKGWMVIKYATLTLYCLLQ